MSVQDWRSLSRSEVTGAGQAFAERALRHAGYEVARLDVHGITDLIATRPGERVEVTVRTLRGLTYTFVEKARFDLRLDRAVALVLLLPGQQAQVFLVPATAWRTPNTVLVDRDYVDGQSEPEWGIALSATKLDLLAPYEVDVP